MAYSVADDYPIYRSSHKAGGWTPERLKQLSGALKSEGFMPVGWYGERSKVPGVGSAFYIELNYLEFPCTFALALTPYAQEAVWVESPLMHPLMFTQYSDPRSAEEQVLELLYICLENAYMKMNGFIKDGL